MNLDFYIVDVFTDAKYAGNQLAVFLGAETLSKEKMQKIAKEINFAESTFITQINTETNTAEIKIFTPEHEMQFAGHPIIGTSWVLMNKIFNDNPSTITMQVPVGAIPVHEKDGFIWLQAAQPTFLDVYLKVDFSSFSTLSQDDFDINFPIQEVTTGSAFVMVPVKNEEVLGKIVLDKNKAEQWLRQNCKTPHRAFYFFCLENEKLSSRMMCIENNQLIEDAATGSASTCLQAFLLQYHSPEIKLVNHQGHFIHRPSQIYFDGTKSGENYEIKIGGKSQFLAKGVWEV